MHVQAVTGGVPINLHTCGAAPMPAAAGQACCELELGSRAHAAIKLTLQWQTVGLLA